MLLADQQLHRPQGQAHRARAAHHPLQADAGAPRVRPLRGLRAGRRQLEPHRSDRAVRADHALPRPQAPAAGAGGRAQRPGGAAAHQGVLRADQLPVPAAAGPVRGRVLLEHPARRDAARPAAAATAAVVQPQQPPPARTSRATTARSACRTGADAGRQPATPSTDASRSSRCRPNPRTRPRREGDDRARRDRRRRTASSTSTSSSTRPARRSRRRTPRPTARCSSSRNAPRVTRMPRSEPPGLATFGVRDSAGSDLRSYLSNSRARVSSATHRYDPIEKSFLVQKFAKLRFGQFHVVGYCVAGEETVVQIPELNVCFDIGRCPYFALTSDIVCITHGHMDHLAGLRLLPLAALLPGDEAGHGPPAARARAAGRHAAASAGATSSARARRTSSCRCRAGSSYEVRRDFGIRAFATHHGGAEPRLRAHQHPREAQARVHAAQPGPELAAMRKRGVEIQYRLEVPARRASSATRRPAPSSTSPTCRTPRSSSPSVTFFDPDHKLKAKAGRHLHVDHFAEILPKLKNQHIVIAHVSRRTGIRQARHLLAQARRRGADEEHPLPDGLRRRQGRGRSRRPGAAAAGHGGVVKGTVAHSSAILHAGAERVFERRPGSVASIATDPGRRSADSALPRRGATSPARAEAAVRLTRARSSATTAGARRMRNPRNARYVTGTSSSTSGSAVTTAKRTRADSARHCDATPAAPPPPNSAGQISR